MLDSDGVLLRFNRLMRDIETGATSRNCFCRWEVELLLDFDSCDLGEHNRRRLVRRYRNAVERELARGATRPLLLSEYLARHQRRPATPLRRVLMETQP